MVTKKITRIVQLLQFNIQNISFYFSNSFKYPLVTLIVPVYNEEQFVADCLNSIKRQTYKNIECIIVNDCSTDNSRQVIKRLIEGDPRFKIIDHDINKGLSASRNTGLNHAKGELITFLDSDDFLFYHSIFRRVLTLVTNDSPQVAGSYCENILVSENGHSSTLRWAPFQLIRGESIDFISSNGECPFNVHAPMLKTNIIKKFGGFEETMRRGAEDWDLWARMLRHGYRFISSHIIGGIYRQKRGGMVKSMPADHVNESIRLINQAYSEWPANKIVAGTPYVFKEPLNYYQLVVIRSKRVISFAILAYLAGDLTGLEQILKFLDPNSGYYLRDRINLNSIVDSSIARFYGVTPVDDVSEQKEYEKQAKEIIKIIRKKVDW